MNTCLVTGVGGFIGSTLANALLERGSTVRGLDNFMATTGSARKRENIASLLAHRRFELCRADLADADLRIALEDVDTVFHLAAIPGVRDSWGESFAPYIANNIFATQRLLEAAKDHGKLRSFVYASSSSVYGSVDAPVDEHHATRPNSPYGVTKLAAEHLCMLYAANYRVPAVAVRYFTVFGPRQRPDMAFTKMLTALYAGKEIDVYGDGTQMRDFTYVDDAVDATISAALRGVPGRVYNIGGGATASLLDAIAAMSRITGQDARLNFLERARGDVARTSADISLARRELHFDPKFDLETGLTLQALWLERAKSATSRRLAMSVA